MAHEQLFAFLEMDSPCRALVWASRGRICKFLVGRAMCRVIYRKPLGQSIGKAERACGTSVPDCLSLLGTELISFVFSIVAQLGTIRRQIGQVNEAAESFEQALVLDPDSGLALEGAGEAYLAQAHARMTEGLCTAAAESLRKGCDVVRRLLRRVSTCWSSGRC